MTYQDRPVLTATPQAVAASDPLSAQSERYEAFITFETPLPCLLCGAPAQWGHIKEAADQFTFEAYCPQHGFAQRTSRLGTCSTNTPQERQEQEESVARFVVAMQDGQGHASVLAPIRPELAPGFHVWQAEDFESEEDYEAWRIMRWQLRAWSVRYVVRAGAEPVYFIVVFAEEHTQFHLCSQDGSCRPPQHRQRIF